MGPLTARLHLARSADDVLAIGLDHLTRVLRYPIAGCLHLDARDGHLRGPVRVDGRRTALIVDLDPMASGPVTRALGTLPTRGPLSPGSVHPALDGVSAWVTAPLLRSPQHAEPAPCPRVDCPERCRRLGVCGSSASGGDAWTRDRLTCGLAPILGALFAAREEGPESLTASDEAELLALARECAPTLTTFRLQEAFHDAEYFREDLFDSMTEALIATDGRGDVLYINRAAEELTGTERHEALGRPLEVVFSDAGGGLSPARRTLRDGEPVPARECRLRRRDGSETSVRVTTTPITARGWGVRGALVAFVDVSPLEEMERKIRRLDRLATLGRVSAAVAHEVRNPLGGILAGVQYLKTQGAGSAELVEHLAVIEAETHRLNRIVTDLSDAASTRAIATGPLLLDPVMHRVAAVLEHEAGARGVRLEVQGGAPAVVADADGITQLLLNLCRNAIEACPEREGCVLQRAECETLDGRPGVRLSVLDNGPGLGEAARDHLFEPFFTTKPRGTGLGLYVCHTIAERHGTTIEVASRHGQTRFSLVLPVAQPGGSS
jgi:PAS domain S-box-containing protein